MKNFNIQKIQGQITKYAIDQQQSKIYYSLQNYVISQKFTKKQQVISSKMQNRISDFLIDKNDNIFVINDQSDFEIEITNQKTNITRSFYNETTSKQQCLCNKIVFDSQNYLIYVIQIFEDEVHIIILSKTPHSIIKVKKQVFHIQVTQCSLHLINIQNNQAHLLITCSDQFHIIEIKFDDYNLDKSYLEQLSKERTQKQILVLMKKSVVTKSQIIKIEADPILGLFCLLMENGKLGIFNYQGKFLLNFTDQLQTNKCQQIQDICIDNQHLYILDQYSQIFQYKLHNLKFIQQQSIPETNIKKIIIKENIVIVEKSNLMQVIQLKTKQVLMSQKINIQKIIEIFQHQNKVYVIYEDFHLDIYEYSEDRWQQSLITKIENNIGNILKADLNADTLYMFVYTDLNILAKVNLITREIEGLIKIQTEKIVQIKYVTNQRLVLLRNQVGNIYVYQTQLFLRQVLKIDAPLSSHLRNKYKIFITKEDAQGTNITYIQNENCIQTIRIIENTLNQQYQSFLVNQIQTKEEIKDWVHQDQKFYFLIKDKLQQFDNTFQIQGFLKLNKSFSNLNFLKNDKVYLSNENELYEFCLNDQDYKKMIIDTFQVEYFALIKQQIFIANKKGDQLILLKQGFKKKQENKKTIQENFYQEKENIFLKSLQQKLPKKPIFEEDTIIFQSLKSIENIFNKQNTSKISYQILPDPSDIDEL